MVFVVRAIACLLSKQEVKLNNPQVYHPIICPKQKIGTQQCFRIKACKS